MPDNDNPNNGFSNSPQSTLSPVAGLGCERCHSGGGGCSVCMTIEVKGMLICISLERSLTLRGSVIVHVVSERGVQHYEPNADAVALLASRHTIVWALPAGAEPPIDVYVSFECGTERNPVKTFAPPLAA